MKVWKLTIAIAFLAVSFLCGCASTFGPGCNCGNVGAGYYQDAPSYGTASSAAGSAFQPAPSQAAPARSEFGGSGGR